MDLLLSKLVEYKLKLKNLKDNRALECDTLSDAENESLDRQINMVAEFCRDLKNIFNSLT